MSCYHHLTIEEREKLYLFENQGMSVRQIALLLHRSPSTISRELKRNAGLLPCQVFGSGEINLQVSGVRDQI